MQAMLRNKRTNVIDDQLGNGRVAAVGQPHANQSAHRCANPIQSMHHSHSFINAIVVIVPQHQGVQEAQPYKRCTLDT
jgi:hypothetical protein